MGAKGYWRDEKVWVVMRGFDEQENELGGPFTVFWNFNDAVKFRERVASYYGTATIREATMVNARFVEP